MAEVCVVAVLIDSYISLTTALTLVNRWSLIRTPNSTAFQNGKETWRRSMNDEVFPTTRGLTGLLMAGRREGGQQVFRRMCIPLIGVQHGPVCPPAMAEPADRWLPLLGSGHTEDLPSRMGGRRLSTGPISPCFSSTVHYTQPSQLASSAFASAQNQPPTAQHDQWQLRMADAGPTRTFDLCGPRAQRCRRASALVGLRCRR